jgi:GNAT superfamily N-acetyltransferase
VDDTLAAVLAFDRGVRVRAAQRVTEFPGGVAVRHDELRRLYHLNAVLLETADDADEVVRVADEHLAGLAHRHVVIDDAAAADRLAPALCAAGWTRQRVTFMRAEREPDRRPPAGLARVIDDAVAHTLQLELLAEEAPPTSGDLAGPALAELLVAGQEAVRAGTRSTCFAAGHDGQLDSMCTLLLSPEPGGIAMIDEVGTRTSQRGRGLARAVVTAAMEAARDEASDPIVVPADADDWPQLLYVKLGFEPLGTQVTFTRA